MAPVSWDGEDGSAVSIWTQSPVTSARSRREISIASAPRVRLTSQSHRRRSGRGRLQSRPQEEDRRRSKPRRSGRCWQALCRNERCQAAVENKVELFDQPCSKASSASKITIEDESLSARNQAVDEEERGDWRRYDDQARSCIQEDQMRQAARWLQPAGVEVSEGRTGWGTQGVVVEKKLTTLVNEGTARSSSTSRTGMSSVMQQAEAGGNILQTRGSTHRQHDAMPADRMSGQLAGACGADQQCNGALDAAKTCAQAGGDPIQCMQMNAVQTNAFRDTMQCFSQSAWCTGCTHRGAVQASILGQEAPPGCGCHGECSCVSQRQSCRQLHLLDQVSAPSATATGVFAPGANGPSTGLVAPHSPVSAQSASTSGMSTSMLALAAVGSVAALWRCHRCQEI